MFGLEINPEGLLNQGIASPGFAQIVNAELEWISDWCQTNKEKVGMELLCLITNHLVMDM